jgi:hypothetical protein
MQPGSMMHWAGKRPCHHHRHNFSLPARRLHYLPDAFVARLNTLPFTGHKPFTLRHDNSERFTLSLTIRGLIPFFIQIFLKFLHLIYAARATTSTYFLY